jgi:hypothetical protein
MVTSARSSGSCRPCPGADDEGIRFRGAANVMKYGPNSEQVEAYLQQVAALDADDWASLALVLKDSTGPRAAAVEVIDTAQSRARKRGLLSDVDAAAREARETMDSILDASTGLREVIDRALVRVGSDDPALTLALRGAGVAALRTAATSGATLLVLRPLLKDDEFTEAWPMSIIDPRSLPRHVSLPPIGAVG